jgi:hypothetical protein
MRGTFPVSAFTRSSATNRLRRRLSSRPLFRAASIRWIRTRFKSLRGKGIFFAATEFNAAAKILGDKNRSLLVTEEENPCQTTRLQGLDNITLWDYLPSPKRHAGHLFFSDKGFLGLPAIRRESVSARELWRPIFRARTDTQPCRIRAQSSSGA